MGLPGLHPKLTVLPAGLRERPSLTERLARLLVGAPQPLGPKDLQKAARQAALVRVDRHAETRDELTVELKRNREQQAVIANRRDEAAARARRLTSHLSECEMLQERSTELTKEADEAQQILDERRAELEAARDRLSLVDDQRSAASRAIEDAQSQLAELESAELDESTLRRELERTGQEQREAEVAHANATAALEAIETAAAERAAAQADIARERDALVADIEAPVLDPEPLREALAGFDAESQPQLDITAHDLAREWAEVNDELSRIETALPQAPSEQQISTAEHNLAALRHAVAELEASNQHQQRLHPAVREQIEAAHEGVLQAEEYLDQSGGHPRADAQLEAARVAEQQILHSYGFETYLDVVMTEPGEAQADLAEAMRAERHAEDTLASMWAATEPPQIVVTLRARRERIAQESANLLCVDPGDNLTELLHNHPAVPHERTRHLAEMLASYGVYPVGVSVRDAAIDLLLRVEGELSNRDQLYADVERLDDEAVALDEDEAADAEEAHRLYEAVDHAAATLEDISIRVESLERELLDRSVADDRRLQRAAAAEQLRAQIAAVTEALHRSDEDYHVGVAEAEAAATGAEAQLEQATAALSDAIRKLRRIAEALPPALRPNASGDPLGDLPRLRETLAGEVERAEVAMANATRDLERARADIDKTQAALDTHLTVTPSRDIQPEDIRQALRDLLAAESDQPVLLDDPFAPLGHDQRMSLLNELTATSVSRSVILLTEHLDTISWAISLPSDQGLVTGLPTSGFEDTSIALPTPSPTAAPPPPTELGLADRPGVTAPST